MIERLRYARRVDKTRDNDEATRLSRWNPWEVEPPRALLGTLLFDPPMAARELAERWAANEALRARTQFDVWAMIDDKWEQVKVPYGDGERRSFRGQRASKLVFFTTILAELISDAWRAELELDRQREEAYEREQGIAPPPPAFESIVQCLQSWRDALGRSGQTQITGSHAALEAELARVRAFCPLEWSAFEGPSMRVILEPRPGDEARSDAALSDALLALGYRLDAREARWRFEPPLGATEGTIHGRVGGGAISLSVPLNPDCSPAQREIVDLLLRSAAALEAELGLRARSAMVPGANLAAIREGATQMIAMLEGDRYFASGALVEDIDEAKLEARALERHALRPPSPRSAGRTLTLRLAPVSGRLAFWSSCAAFAALVAVVKPWVALAALAFALLAVRAHRDKRAPMDVELGLTELVLSTGGATQRFRLPLDHTFGGTDKPIRDADGALVPMPLYDRPSGYAPEDVRALYSAVSLRSALAKRPLAIADRIALETLDAWDAMHPGWCRGRRPGYVAVAITERGGEVLEDQESLDAWSAREASAGAHRVGFVWMDDHSGKGATVGYPSEVRWDGEPRLHPRARVFDDGEDAAQ